MRTCCCGNWHYSLTWEHTGFTFSFTYKTMTLVFYKMTLLVFLSIKYTKSDIKKSQLKTNQLYNHYYLTLSNLLAWRQNFEFIIIKVNKTTVNTIARTNVKKFMFLKPPICWNLKCFFRFNVQLHLVTILCEWSD